MIVEEAARRLIAGAVAAQKLRVLLPIEQRAYRVYGRAFTAQGRAFLKRSRSLAPLFTSLQEAPGPDEWDAVFTSSEVEAGALFKRAAETAAKEGLAAGYAMGASMLKISGAFDVTSPWASEYLAASGARMVKTHETTRDALRLILVRAHEEGWAYSRTAAEISGKFKEFARSVPGRRSRAELIAVTETGMAYEHANQTLGKDLTAQGVAVEKAWLIVGDEKVCGICLPAGTEGWVPYAQTFGNGLVGPLGHPGCRCVLLQQRVAKPLSQDPPESSLSDTEFVEYGAGIDEWHRIHEKYTDHTAGITDKDAKALWDYTRDVNVVKAVRNGKRPGVTKPVDALIEKTGGLKENTKLWRGMSWPKSAEGKAKFEEFKRSAGTTIKDTGYTSTTMQPGVAHQFAMGINSSAHGAGILEIKAPKGTKGIAPGGASAFSNGSEFMLARGTEIRIISVEERSQLDWLKTHVKTTTLPDGSLAVKKVDFIGLTDPTGEDGMASSSGRVHLGMLKKDAAKAGVTTPKTKDVVLHWEEFYSKEIGRHEVKFGESYEIFSPAEIKKMEKRTYFHAVAEIVPIP